VAHLSLALPLAVLTLPILVLAALRIAAAIADARTRARTERVVRAIERAERMQAEPSVTSVSVLTEEVERDQG